MANRETGIVDGFFQWIRRRVRTRGGGSALDNADAASDGDLRDLIRVSRAELARSGNYQDLLARLDELVKALDGGGLSAPNLQAVVEAMPRFPPSNRAGALAGGGLPATRELLVEIRNRIVTFDKAKQQPAKGSG